MRAVTDRQARPGQAAHRKEGRSYQNECGRSGTKWIIDDAAAGSLAGWMAWMAWLWGLANERKEGRKEGRKDGGLN